MSMIFKTVLFLKMVWLILKRNYIAFDSLLLEWDTNDPGEGEQVLMSEKNKFWPSLSS